MRPKKFLLTGGIACLIALLPIIAQQKKASPSLIEQAIAAKEFKKADSLLQAEILHFTATGNIDTIVYFIPFAGKIAYAQFGADKSIDAVTTLTQLLKSKKAPAAVMVDGYRASAEFFSSIGKNQAGYDASKQALVYASQENTPNELNIARCEYNLGIYAHRLGNVGLSLTHHREAMRIREANGNSNPEDVYLSANAMGSLMWYASKYDSAALLFNRALTALGKMPDNDINKYFRPGNIQNNLAALYSAEGKTTEAIAAMQQTISNFQQFIVSKDPASESKKQSATEGLYEAIDNLAGIYKEVGDYGKTGQLLRYSYEQKKLKLDSTHPGIFISEILLGQYYQAIREYDSAMVFLLQGLHKLEHTEGDYLFWAADAYYTKALVHQNKAENNEAAAAYSKSEELYESSYQGQYDNVYMDFLRNASLFYAKNGDYPKAYERANKVYKYLESVHESTSLQAFYQLLNIAEINYLTRRYREAIDWCNTALKVVKEKQQAGATLLDSIKIDALRPKAILINAKSAYELQPKKDTSFLKQVSAELNEALTIVSKRKTVIHDEASINILIADYQDLIDFAKKIEWQLASLTGQSAHIDRLINLQESAVYNRIRGRLDKQQAIQFSGIPATLHQQELELKNAISASLSDKSSDANLIKNYISATRNWEAYLAKMKSDYPQYYTMRYASIFKSLPQLQSLISDSSTVIRYFMVDTNVVALVFDRQSKMLIPLQTASLEPMIDQLLRDQHREKSQLPVLHELYKILWQPLEQHIHTSKITIIPDGVLYNLNFEMLATRPVEQYKALAENSLLASYTISYHYSLFMLNGQKAAKPVKDNYVAFAPSFSDEVKKKYLTVAHDSATLDYQYLRLLPQPATHDLAKKMGGLFDGNTFLDEASTRRSFEKNAGGHKIIHIGTHASFNNINPEQSGLIFAKSPQSPDSNFLPLFDIYGCNMESDLTILTACESGRPGYQDGEGMVSLAHAFNYAGSERILTALWKIDEHSSSAITENFILNLKNGLATDEALRRAKLEYLRTAEGRVLAPAYWAGLVMIGEPAQLRFEKSGINLYWILGGIALLAMLIMVFFIRSGKYAED